MNARRHCKGKEMTLKAAIVTGASSGIGLGIAKALLEAGYYVVANSRNITTSGALPPSDHLFLVDGDIGDPATGIALAKVAQELAGGVSLLVNNAGIFAAKPFEDYTPEDFDAFVRTNLAGFFYTSQAAVRLMKAQGSGHIVNISTTIADQPIMGVPAALPVLTKGGLNAATKALAIELANDGIRVNAIGAGVIDTPMHSPESHSFLKTLHPIQRLGTVEEIIDAVVYLEKAAFVTGEVLHVDGGAHAGKW